MKQPIAPDKATDNILTTGGASGVSRRGFFKVAGALAGAGVLASACHKSDNKGVNLGSGDTGVLNYAYLLEQLEAAFYTQVINTPYAGMPTAELLALTAVRDHEIAHREFFRNALGSSRIPDVTVDFSSINFSDRNSVLGAAKTFEDLGVAAYNGAGKLLLNSDYLLIAGKIVSVEARHAAYIRDLISPNSFADGSVVDGQGLDSEKSPSTVLSAASKYLKTKIDGSQLPNF